MVSVSEVFNIIDCRVKTTQNEGNREKERSTICSYKPYVNKMKEEIHVALSNVQISVLEFNQNEHVFIRISNYGTECLNVNFMFIAVIFKPIKQGPKRGVQRG